MSSRSMFRRWCCWLVLLGIVTGVVPGGARLGMAGPPGAGSAFEGRDQSRQAVNSGVELERSRKWLDAIEHYEKSIKLFPESKELEYGLRRSRIHFGIERRYADSSFQKSLLSMTRLESMNLFDEVLAKVQGHYVDPVTMTSFVAHGTESVYLALADEKFLQKHLPVSRRTDELQRVRRTLRDEFWNKSIANREQAHSVIGRVCEMCESNLNIPSSAIVLEYIFGGCNSLDDYSGYLTPSRLNDLYGNIEGQFVGLGIEMKAELGKGLLLVNVLPDSPAAEGGLVTGEHIVKIDQQNCVQMTTDEAASRLQGLEGSRVSLEVQRGAESRPRRVTLTRRPVVVKSIPIAKMIDTTDGIGYIQMVSFQKSSAQELDQALQQLRQQGMRALIWDVRGNPGGLLTASVEVLDRFINEGVLVSTKGRTADQNWTYNAHRPGTWNLPLVVLIDGESASASEIVAGAIRDHRRGTLVGRKTYGKWSVQSIFPVTGNSGLRVTTAKFYSPAGHTLGKIGVQPHIEVSEPDKRRTYFRAPTDIDAEGDADIQKGMEVLRKQIANR